MLGFKLTMTELISANRGEVGNFHGQAGKHTILIIGLQLFVLLFDDLLSNSGTGPVQDHPSLKEGRSPGADWQELGNAKHRHANNLRTSKTLTDWAHLIRKKNRRARPQNPGLRVHSEPKKIHILREKHWKPLTELSPSLMLWSLLPDIEAPLNDLKTVCSCWEVPGWSNWFWNWHPLDNIWKIKIPFEGFTFLLSDQKTSWAGPIPGPSKSQDFLFVSPLSNFWMLSPKTSGIFA